LTRGLAFYRAKGVRLMKKSGIITLRVFPKSPQ